MDDNFLIQQTLAGNKHAFRFIVLRYQKPVFKVLSAIIRDRAVVEELAQDAFSRAYKALANYDPSAGATFSTWLFTIARNLALNEIEKLRVRNVALPNDVAEAAAETRSPEEPLAIVEKAQLAQKVREAIAKLPHEFKTAVVLSCIEQHSIAEIAAIEGCSEGTVKSRIFRGKQMLCQLLAPLRA